jgi:hypothetical protein
MTIRSTEILPLTLMFPVLLNADGGGSRSRQRPARDPLCFLILATNIRFKS